MGEVGRLYNQPGDLWMLLFDTDIDKFTSIIENKHAQVAVL